MMHLSQFAVTTITIIASALAGAAAMMGIRILLKRRRLFAALHTELLVNHAKCRTISEMNDSQFKNSFVRSPNTEFNRTAFDLLKKDAPILHARLRQYSENLTMSYRHLRAFDYVDNDQESLYQRYDLNNPIGSEMSEKELEGMEEFVDDIIDILDESFKDSIEEVEEYSQESLLRRIVYWNCF